MHHGLVTRGEHRQTLSVVGKALEVPTRIRRPNPHSPIHRSKRISRILCTIVTSSYDYGNPAHESTHNRLSRFIHEPFSSKGNRNHVYTVSESRIDRFIKTNARARRLIAVLSSWNPVVDDLSLTRDTVASGSQDRHHRSGVRTCLICRCEGTHGFHSDISALQLRHSRVGRPVDHADLDALARETSRHLVLNAQGTHVLLRRDLINRTRPGRARHAQSDNHAQRHHNAGKARADAHSANPARAAATECRGAAARRTDPAPPGSGSEHHYWSFFLW